MSADESTYAHESTHMTRCVQQLLSVRSHPSFTPLGHSFLALRSSHSLVSLPSSHSLVSLPRLPPPTRRRAEMLMCVFLMLIASLIWASVIGTYCGVVATLNPELAAFHEMIQDLNRFMARENLPSPLQCRLREYFHKSKHLRLAQAQQRL